MSSVSPQDPDRSGAQLPLPIYQGGPGVPFAEASTPPSPRGVTRMECFRRICAVTGKCVNGLSLRYLQRGGCGLARRGGEVLAVQRCRVEPGIYSRTLADGSRVF
jgi:hypothetical protein